MSPHPDQHSREGRPVRAVQYRFGRFRLAPLAREFWLDDQLQSLPRLLFDCLAYLVDHRDRAIGRDELVSAVWGRVDVPDAHVSQLILRVRRLVGDDGQSQHAVRTVAGFGYRWVLPVHVLAPAAETPDDDPVSSQQAGPNAEPGMPSIPADAGVTPLPAPQMHAPEAVAPPPRRAESRVRGSRGAWIGLLFGSAATALVAWFVGHRDARDAPAAEIASPASAGAGVVVLPIEVDGPREATWVRLGAMELIGDRLRRAGLAVLPSENVLMQLRDRPSSPAADRIDPRLGIGVVVQGSAVRSAQGWTVVLKSTLANGRSLRADASDADVIAAATRASDLFLREGFGRSVPGSETSEDSPLLQRLGEVRAAMLDGDLDAAKALLGALPAPLDKDPRTLLLKARVGLAAGRLEEASTVLDSLLAGATLEKDSVAYGEALSLRGRLNYRARRFAEAERDYDEAVRVLHDTGAPDRYGDALAGRAITRTVLRRLDAAEQDLGQARIQLQEAGDRAGLAQVDMYFGVVAAERGRFEATLPYLAKASESFEVLGVAERAVTSLLALLNAQAELLQWTDALTSSDRQWKLRERVADSRLRLVVTARRVRILLALGRLEEAARLADEAAAGSAGQPQEGLRYLYDLQADVAYARGRWRDAAQAAERALALWPNDPGAERRAWLILLRQRALIATGDGTAERIQPNLDAAGGAEATPALEVARAEWAARRSDERGAARHYDKALALASDEGSRARFSLVVQSYARWLLDRGKLDEATALVGRIGDDAARDFDSALAQLEVLHRSKKRELWQLALHQARRLAGERPIPAALAIDPGAPATPLKP